MDDFLAGTGGMSSNPQLVSTSAETPDKWDYRLKASSPLIDKGEPDEVDPDENRCDMGAFSGPNAGNFDLDGDGSLAWWGPDERPGAPWDCDDLDQDVTNECW
jgi:hypothetical protein